MRDSGGDEVLGRETAENTRERGPLVFLGDLPYLKILTLRQFFLVLTLNSLLLFKTHSF